jgi:hypothetical protein
MTHATRRTAARPEEFSVNIDTEKLDQAALALLCLGLHEGSRTWKGLDWEVMRRLHEKGLHHRPREQGEIGPVH